MSQPTQPDPPIDLMEPEIMWDTSDADAILEDETDHNSEIRAADAPDHQREIRDRLYEASYHESHPLVANVGIATWQLLGLNSVLHESAIQYFRNVPNEPGEIAKCYQHLEILLKVNRQIERFAQLQDRVSRPRASAPIVGHNDSHNLESVHRKDLQLSGESGTKTDPTNPASPDSALPASGAPHAQRER